MADTNLILNKPLTADSYVAPYLPGLAVNGNKTSPMNRWLGNRSPGWLMANLGDNFTITRWVVTMLTNANWPANRYSLQNFRLQTSTDGVNWTTVDTVNNNAASIVDRTLPSSAPARYVRLYIDKGLNVNPQLASVLEIEVFGHPAGGELSSLVLSSGALVPAFSAGNLNYTQQVPFAVGSVTVTPTVATAGTTVAINGNAAVSGQASAPIALQVGANSIRVEAKSIDGFVNPYTIALTRVDNLLLEKVVVTPFGRGAGAPVVIGVDGSTVNLSANIPNASTFTVTPYAQGSTVVVSVNGNTVASGSASQSISLATSSLTVPINIVDPNNNASLSYILTVTK